jgi:hypothetical protein
MLQLLPIFAFMACIRGDEVDAAMQVMAVVLFSECPPQRHSARVLQPVRTRRLIQQNGELQAAPCGDERAFLTGFVIQNHPKARSGQRIQ